MFLPILALAQPLNDTCETATSIPDFGCFDGDNYDAMDDIVSCQGCQAPNCGRHDEVWFSFVATTTSVPYSLTSVDLGYMEILLYDVCSNGSSGLIQFDCGSTPIDGSLGSLTIGETYWVAISSDDNNEGEFNLCLSTSLPVELVNFYGYDDDEINVLEWETASESDNDYFVIERSESGYSWEPIGKVDGAGDSSIRLYYNFTDENPYPSYSYYRLKQVDFDGGHEYSDIISIENKTGVFYTYTTEPKDGFIYFSGPYHYEFINILGEAVRFGKSDKVDTNGLAQGLYILKIGNWTQKFYLN